MLVNFKRFISKLTAGFSLCAIISLSAGFSGQVLGYTLPDSFSEFGLYEDIENNIISDKFSYYEPAFPLWSDGLTKLRYFYIPGEERIDTADFSSWVFPVGSIFFKEFRSGDVKIETRVLVKEFNQEGQATWQFSSYQWNSESDAEKVSIAGVLQAYPLGTGSDGMDIFHDIPGEQDCLRCHEDMENPVLGFNYMQLKQSPDEHSFDLLKNLDVFADDLTEKHHSFDKLNLKDSKLGQIAAYLDTNCGNCHSQTGSAFFTGLLLDIPAGIESISDLPLVQTGINMPGTFHYIEGCEQTYILVADDLNCSSLYTRLADKTNIWVAMPPLGSKLVDEEFVELLEAWAAEEVAAQ